MANIESNETTSRPMSKTTETLIKELETMSDSGLHDMFIFFYKLNHSYQGWDSQNIICHIYADCFEYLRCNRGKRCRNQHKCQR